MMTALPGTEQMTFFDLTPFDWMRLSMVPATTSRSRTMLFCTAVEGRGKTPRLVNR